MQANDKGVVVITYDETWLSSTVRVFPECILIVDV